MRREKTLLSTYIQGNGANPKITVGFLGFGRVARKVAELLQPWKVKIIAYSPSVSVESMIEAKVEAVSLDILLKESDVLSLHTALTPEKRHIIGEAQLKMMKKNAYIVNTARGALIDTEALVKALRKKWISGAALDTFEKEPLPLDSQLLTQSNTILSGHVAAYNNNTNLMEESIELGTANVLKALRGEIPQNIINPNVIPKWIKRFT